MKRFFVFFTLFAAVALTGAAAGPASQKTAPQPSSQEAAAELSFTFTRQSGHASNQFAVWIEDAQGNYVKTIYAARYTANGGWKRRETSIPVWVRKSGLSGMDKTQIDALTGATPGSGTLTYSWDGTDSSGAVLPAGGYVICLEGTLRWESQVMYRAPVSIGQGPSAAQVGVEYTGTPPADERSMIEDVAVRALR